MDAPDVNALSRCPLFEGMEMKEIQDMLTALSASERVYARGETVIAPGSRVTELGIVLEGSVQVWQTDYWGHQTLIHKLEAGEVFAESFALAEECIPLGVNAAERCRVLFLPVKPLLAPRRHRECFAGPLLHQLTRMIAAKNISLTGNIRHLSKRSIENKLLSYLSELAAAQGSDEPLLPLARQELADFLCIDRSAMTRTLYQMQSEGRLTVSGRKIRLSSERPEP